MVQNVQIEGPKALPPWGELCEHWCDSHRVKAPADINVLLYHVNMHWHLDAAFNYLLTPISSSPYRLRMQDFGKPLFLLINWICHPLNSPFCVSLSWWQLKGIWAFSITLELCQETDQPSLFLKLRKLINSFLFGCLMRKYFAPSILLP